MIKETCPFCNSSKVRTTQEKGDYNFWTVICICGAEGPPRATEKMAIDSWDKREGEEYCYECSC